MNTLIILGAKYLFAAVLIGAALPLTWLPKDARRQYLVLAVMSGLLAFALTKLAGALYFDPRPFTHGVRALIAHEPDNGFPSDHTTLCFTSAAVALSVSRPTGLVLLFLATLVGMCRELSGVHAPIDVIAGALIGLASAGVGILISTRLAKTTESKLLKA